MSIEDYELESDTWSVLDVDDDGNVIIDSGVDFVTLTKNDVIALAKHFKLTEEDLK